MPFMQLDRPCFLRQELLDSEAVYEVVAEEDELVTAEVVRAPGLPRGMRVKLLAEAVRQMERSEHVAPSAVLEPSAPVEAPALRHPRFAAR
ncbi:MAG: hypothetical protein ABSB73_04120 [Solirubrobacteraceae bacterium]|jgi:hypothetical protein